MFQAGNVEMIALMGPFINDCSRDRFGKECMQYISKISVESKWQKIHIKRFLGKFIAIAQQFDLEIDVVIKELARHPKYHFLLEYCVQSSSNLSLLPELASRTVPRNREEEILDNGDKSHFQQAQKLLQGSASSFLENSHVKNSYRMANENLKQNISNLYDDDPDDLEFKKIDPKETFLHESIAHGNVLAIEFFMARCQIELPMDRRLLEAMIFQNFSSPGSENYIDKNRVVTLEKYRAIRQKQKEYASQGGRFANVEDDSESSDDDMSGNYDRKRKKKSKKHDKNDSYLGLSGGDTLLHVLARMNIDQDDVMDLTNYDGNTASDTVSRSSNIKTSVFRTVSNETTDNAKIKTQPKTEKKSEQEEALQKKSFDFMYSFIDYLINDEKIQLNKRNDQGYTALHVAASDKTISGFENSLFVKCLVKWTEDNKVTNWIDYMSNDGVTALGKAAANGKCEVCRILIEEGKDMTSKADPDLEMKDRWTALTFAIRYNQMNVVKYLTKIGDRRSKEQGTRLGKIVGNYGRKASICGNETERFGDLLPKYFHNRVNTRVKNSELNRTLLMVAIIYSNREVLEYLLTKTCLAKQINIQDDAEKTCFYLLATRDSANVKGFITQQEKKLEKQLCADILTLMVDKGLDVEHHSEMHYRFYEYKKINSKNNKELMATITKLQKKQEDDFKQNAMEADLLRYVFKMDVKKISELVVDSEDRCVMQVDIGKSFIPLKDKMCGLSVEDNDQKPIGANSLHILLRQEATDSKQSKKMLEIVKILLEKTNQKNMPDLYQYDKNGYQPFHYAAMYGHADIVEYLLNRSDAKTLIRSYSIVIQDGKVADKKGMPAIFLAAKKNKPKIVKILLKNPYVRLTICESADSNVPLEGTDPLVFMPLYIANEKDRKVMYEAFMDEQKLKEVFEDNEEQSYSRTELTQLSAEKVDFLAQQNRYRTKGILQMALTYEKGKIWPEIIRGLIEYQPKLLLAVSSDKQTAFHFAVKSGDLDKIKLMVESFKDYSQELSLGYQYNQKAHGTNNKLQRVDNVQDSAPSASDLFKLFFTWQDQKGDTILHLVATLILNGQGNIPAIIEYLLELDARDFHKELQSGKRMSIDSSSKASFSMIKIKSRDTPSKPKGRLSETSKSQKTKNKIQVSVSSLFVELAKKENLKGQNALSSILKADRKRSKQITNNELIFEALNDCLKNRIQEKKN